MSHIFEPREAIAYLLQHTGEMLERQLDQTLQEQLGIGSSQYKLLGLLEEGAERGQRTLADNLGQTEAAVSRQISILGKKGYIVGRINEKNRRQHLVVITPKGMKLLAAARQVIDRSLASLDTSMPEKQQKQLQELLVSMHAWTCQKGKSAICDHPFDI